MTSKNKISILYATSFYAGGHSGHSRATKQKARALKNLSQCTFFSLPMPGIVGWLLYPIIEAQVLLSSVFKGGAVISRGVFSISLLLLPKRYRPLLAREIHSLPFEELQESQRSLKLFGRYIYEYLENLLHRRADLRIFNHPALRDIYTKVYGKAPKQIVSYNAADIDHRSRLSKHEARSAHGLPQEAFICCYVGSGAAWHGVDYLINLAQKLTGEDRVLFLIAGPKQPVDDYPSNIRWVPHVHPTEAAQFMRASDVCLLPVKHVRKSPGSPLKLYDYLANERFVLTQEDLVGYSDEVARHSLPVFTDFTAPSKAAKDLMHILENRLFDCENIVSCPTWEDRLSVWIDILNDMKKV